MKKEILKESEHGYPGLLIAIDGTDGAGRTTQINKLQEWLSVEGYGVVVSEWKTSKLISKKSGKATGAHY